ncbi:MAG: HAMP domain-containing sensor histidine kinase [Niameybacter sp.]|uniref:sensor histidine kinase n=1 Tax=Niameybacter sp. TaxID=2033640 RepID=UPI002FCC449B
MKTRIRIGILIVCILIIYLGLDVYLMFMTQDEAIIKGVVVGQIMSLIAGGGIVILVKREVTTLLCKLSQSLENMMGEHPEEVFQPLKDELPSKIQVQMNRLGKILQTHNQQVTLEKEQIQEMIGDIAHQLKTPLANVSLYTELLSIQAEQGPDCELYEDLQGEVEKLKFLTEEFIKMSRLESGVIKLNLKPCQLSDTCLQAIKQVYMKAKAKHIDIVCEPMPNLEIFHDSKWTGEALNNILDNAIKYSDEKSIITLCVIPYEVFVRVDIKDQGYGIDEEEMNAIFRRFFRGEEASDIEGVGIGLYLARKIIMDQGGYIKVSSKKGEGSIFSVFLPMK